MSESNGTPAKKRHHFVPIVYLANFVGADGRLCVYNNDDGSEFSMKPEAIGFERYYYAQPLSDGERDTNTLEDFFSKAEAAWGEASRRMIAGESVNGHLEAIYSFVALQRARVPAARDLTETALSAGVLSDFERMDQAGLLPPKPPELLARPDVKFAVAIDPHQSLHGIAYHLKRFSRLLDRLAFDVLHNETSVTFLTSDNPVAYFDPNVPEKSMQPYETREPNGPVELLFPLDPRTILRGTMLTGKRSPNSILHRRLKDEAAAHRFNRIAARFAYRMAFASDRSHRGVVRRYAALSPVLRDAGPIPGTPSRIIARSQFGPRPKKPRW